jgi:hypothetical protein
MRLRNTKKVQEDMNIEHVYSLEKNNAVRKDPDPCDKIIPRLTLFGVEQCYKYNILKLHK